MADGLAARGWHVDVLTGCARDHFREPHHYPAGETRRASGARVCRFASVVSHDRADRVLGNRALERGEVFDLVQQYQWCNDDVRVPGLFEYLLDHGPEYRALVFAPYLYWTTVAGSLAAPERSIVMPCLHDEPAARLALYDRTFRESRGRWFLTEPEAALAERLRPALGASRVIGSGVDVPEVYDPDGFRDRYGIDREFVLYAGRREAGKGFDAFVDAFVTAVERGRLPLRLVVAGPGVVRLSPRARNHVIDVGALGDRDRDGAMAAATAVLQPSPYESFSRTMMEAWLARSFVIANGASEVSVWHCARSGAGTTYDDTTSLIAALEASLAPDAAARAEAGRAYVLREYTWPVVLDRVEASFDEWFPALP
jgi:glycosyltransferase involved in cell wall biosynthesis